MEDRAVFPSQEQLESTLKEIRGVIAARVVVSGEVIEEVHILADSERNPKQVVRDIESALQARYAIAIDHKKVSVAQIEGNGNLPPVGTLRLRLLSVAFSTSDNTAQAKVELMGDKEKYQGEAAGPGTRFNKLRLCAAAALSAVESSTKQRCMFLLEDVALATIGRWEAALVVVSTMFGNQEERMIGAVLVEGDQMEAVVKAVLSAVNRRLSFLLG